jgi:hypothetical protein
MRQLLTYTILVLSLGLVWSCGEKDPQPALPSYLRVPSSLSGYEGSGQVIITGGSLNLKAEGSEVLDNTTKTYSGVRGDVIQNDVSAQFTFGQPRPYQETGQVPDLYQANGKITIIDGLNVGVYTMNPRQPGPRGQFAELTLRLPGPQIYIAQDGSLTVEEVTKVKTEGSLSLYRVRGNFQLVAVASGVGLPAGQPANLSGTFDLLVAGQ